MPPKIRCRRPYSVYYTIFQPSGEITQGRHNADIVLHARAVRMRRRLAASINS